MHSKSKCCYFNTKINTFWLRFSNMFKDKCYYSQRHLVDNIALPLSLVLTMPTDINAPCIIRHREHARFCALFMKSCVKWNENITNSGWRVVQYREYWTQKSCIGLLTIHYLYNISWQRKAGIQGKLYENS